MCFRDTVIEFDKVGLIKSGEDKGNQIKICKAENGRGYYLFMCDDFSDINCNIGDHHFDSLEDVIESFSESNWVIQWL